MCNSIEYCPFLNVERFFQAKLNRVGTIGIDSHSFEYSDRFALKNCIRKPETENLSLHSVEMEINLTKKHWAKRLYDCPLNESPLTMVYNNCMIRIQPCRAAHRRHHHHHRDDVNSRGQTSSNCSFRTHTHTHRIFSSVSFRESFFDGVNERRKSMLKKMKIYMRAHQIIISLILTLMHK